ncbi:hypothetical protein BH09VER1_BH09VER1_36090 [soil metagenome]
MGIALTEEVSSLTIEIRIAWRHTQGGIAYFDTDPD